MTWLGEDPASGILAYTEDGSYRSIVGASGQVLSWDPNGAVFKDVPSLGSGISGPGSSTDNAMVRWDGATGQLIQDSLIIVDDSGTITLAGGQIVNGVITSAAAYTIQQTDWLVISTAVVARTITLPGTPTTWQSHNIKDGVGNSKSKHLVVDGNGNTIDGCSEVTINGAYSCFTVVYNGTEWNII
jgi:hypothetical protein